jgi:two-component system, NarL family, response regulator LiaR
MSVNNRIRVLIVDDHGILRSGLKTTLSIFKDIEVVGEAEDGEEAVRLCGELHPAVVLMDLVMPVMDGLEATRKIRQNCPEVRIIALTSFKDDVLIQRVLKAGAISYLLKNVSADALVSAVRAACDGRPSLSPEATQAVIRIATRPYSADYDLTDREMEVLALMVQGASNSDIAARLVIGLSTAKTHVSNVLSKLGVTTRSEAIALAIQRRLVSTPGAATPEDVDPLA